MITGVSVDVQVRDSDDRYGILWPAQEIAVLAHGDDPLAILQILQIAQSTRQDVLEPITPLTVIGVVEGRLAPSLTFRIFDTAIFPAPDEVAAWRPITGLRPLASETFEAASDSISTLITLSAIQILRARRGLHDVEQQAEERAIGALQESLRILARAARISAGEPLDSDFGRNGIEISQPAAETIPGRALVTLDERLQDAVAEEAATETWPLTSGDMPRADPGGLAARFTRMARGEEEELSQTLILLQGAFLLHDVDPDTTPNIGDLDDSPRRPCVGTSSPRPRR